MTTSGGPTSKLCTWACSIQYEDLPAEVRKQTTTVLYDQVGCMIAASTLPSCSPVVNLVRKLGAPGECSVVGHPLRTSVMGAALANGTIGHGDECDSTGQKGTGHFASVVVPAALSVGQHVGASGKQFLRALALGCEVAGRFVSVLGHYDTRPQFSACVGHTMGAAVTAGSLLGLDAEKLEYTLGLAAGNACGLECHHEEEHHQIKSLEKGRAVEGGVLAALLAAEGFHGPKEVLTIEWGYFDAFLGIASAGNDVVKDLGEDYWMHQIAYKRYPIGGPNQTPMYAFIQLMKKHGIGADDIEQIEVTVAQNAYHTVMTNHHPSIHMPDIFPMAAVYGDLTFPIIHEPRYREDPRVKAFKERVRIFITPRSGHATREQRMQAGITVRTRNGKTMQEQVRFPVMTEAEIEKKFHDLVGLRLDSARVAGLERRLRGIESEKNVAPLIRELEIPYK